APTRLARHSLHTRRSSDLEACGLDPDKPTLLILGGSGGARSINEAIARHISTLHNDMQLQIIWQCGKRYYERLRKDINPELFERSEEHSSDSSHVSIAYAV